MDRRMPGLPDGCEHGGTVVGMNCGKIGVDAGVMTALADTCDALNIIELPFKQLLYGQNGGGLKTFRWTGCFHHALLLQ